ncbi:MAG: SpoIIE family protein phosphatase, partial [Firmicutes bacterium]|nr:SpoIIE family protein phosphatase [Bacillota bacterium]
MPLKSFREMTKGERSRYSLEGRVFRSIALYSVLLGLICFALGFGMYLYGLAQDSMDEAADISGRTVGTIRMMSQPDLYAREVMEIFRQNKQNAEDEESYYPAFDRVNDDAGYQQMAVILKNSRTENMSDFFFAVPAPEDGVIVFVADTDPREGHLYPVGKTVKVPGIVQKLFLRLGNGTEFPRTFFFLPSRGLVCVSGAYINETDHKDGCLFVMMNVGTVLKGVRSYAIFFTVIVILVILIAGSLFARRIRREVVKPVNQIADAARNYVNDKREGKENTDHFARLNIRTGDEIENLSLVMAEMERDIDTYVDDLTDATAEKERVDSELNMASKIQAAMLPHVFPPFPDYREFDLYATMEPAKLVGGDFYDFFLIDDDHLCLVMADVSGKGIPASLFMMVTKVILQSCGMLGQSAPEILNKTNQALCKDNQMEMFVTAWVGILEISTGKLTMANAGHEYPVFKKPDGKFELYKDEHGFVLGGFEDETYMATELQLEPGTKLFLYTDGVAEAMDPARNQFGLDRMLDALNETADAP